MRQILRTSLLMRRLTGMLDVILSVTTTVTVALGKPTPLTKRKKIIIIMLGNLEREITTLIKSWTIKSRPAKR